MNLPEQPDPLDALLLEENIHLQDGGFTARVMTSLPRCSRTRTWLRSALLLGAIGLGYILAILWLPSETMDWPLPSTFSFPSMLSCAMLLAVPGSLIWGLLCVLGWEE
jgi:hypothetical protein